MQRWLRGLYCRMLSESRYSLFVTRFPNPVAYIPVSKFAYTRNEKPETSNRLAEPYRLHRLYLFYQYGGDH